MLRVFGVVSLFIPQEREDLRFRCEGKVEVAGEFFVDTARPALR